jgi:hypothetical protein
MTKRLYFLNVLLNHTLPTNRCFHIHRRHQFPYSQDKFYINGIYTAFRLLSPSSDLRSCRDSLGWIKIYEDVINHGYNAASSLNAVILDSQDKSKKKDAVKLSVKHIRNHQQKTEQLLIEHY